MKTIPKDVLQAAKMIAAGCGDMIPAKRLIEQPALGESAICFAKVVLLSQRHAKTDSSWIRLNAAAEVMREWFSKESA